MKIFEYLVLYPLSFMPRFVQWWAIFFVAFSAVALPIYLVGLHFGLNGILVATAALSLAVGTHFTLYWRK